MINTAINTTSKKSDSKSTAVFDFDGTVISKDTGHEFNKWLIKSSLIRSMMMIVVFPIFFLLISHHSTIKLGLNLGCFIASAFQRKSLFQLRKEFLHFFFARADVVVFQQALEQIKTHQQQGDEVLIISGCPNFLLHKIIQRSGLRKVKLMGSEFKKLSTGIIIVNHCFASNKVSMALDKGQKCENWLIGYSDSVTDLPMLKKCKSAVLINGSDKILRQYQRILTCPITQLTWA